MGVENEVSEVDVTGASSRALGARAVAPETIDQKKERFNANLKLKESSATAKAKRVVEDIRSLFPPSYDMQHLNGFVFVDAGKLRLLVTTRGEHCGWVCCQEDDGSWTPVREATRGQLLAMVRAFAAPKVVAL